MAATTTHQRKDRCAAEECRADDPPRLEGQHVRFRRLLDLLRRLRVDRHTGRTGKNGRPQPLGLGQLEEGQLHGRLPAVGHLKLQLGQPKGPRHERLHHVDGLDPVNPGAPLLAEDHPGIDVHVLVRDLVAGEAPRQEEADTKNDDGGAHHGEHRPPQARPLSPDAASRSLLENMDSRSSGQR